MGIAVSCSYCDSNTSQYRIEIERLEPNDPGMHSKIQRKRIRKYEFKFDIMFTFFTSDVAMTFLCKGCFEKRFDMTDGSKEQWSNYRTGITINKKLYTLKVTFRAVWHEPEDVRLTINNRIPRMFTNLKDSEETTSKTPRENLWSDYSKNYSKNNSNNPKPPPTSWNIPSNSSRQILEGYKIHNRKQWKNWLRRHHVDKGGDPVHCQRVITEGKKLGY
jgi:hypothetical protein